MSGNGMAADMLQLRDITVARGGRAVVREVSIDIPAGEVTALLGPNGAGKSSLVLAVGGVLRPEAGSVLLAGRNYAGRRPERIRRAGIAIVPEGRRLLSELTVEDNLRVASYTLSRRRPRPLTWVLELFPEPSRRSTAGVRTLSGGEQQMLVLAQALVFAAALHSDRRAVARAGPRRHQQARAANRRAAEFCIGVVDRAVRPRRTGPGQPRLHHGRRPVAGLPGRPPNCARSRNRSGRPTCFAAVLLFPATRWPYRPDRRALAAAGGH